MVTLRETGDGTTDMDFRLVFPTAEERNIIAEKYGAVEGLVQTMTRLDSLLLETLR